ncbi:MAG: XTP/dITP diphosphatase [Candidatus Thermoplasmatota archaeon]|nr:XTP/dITP diphosphatase [Candidatus Thermoplasmatota archaeon]
MKDETLTVITSNQGKYREYKKRLGDHYEEVEMSNVGYPEIQASRLEEVVDFALEKLATHSPLVIDDSGLFVDALGGFPGVYSAYVMNTIGCDGILSLMEDRDRREARFECVIGYIGEERKKFKGTAEGTIIEEQRGSKGFGYDPIFSPKGYEKTYAEMTSQEKNEISHRGRSMEKFLDFVRTTE